MEELCERCKQIHAPCGPGQLPIDLMSKLVFVMGCVGIAHDDNFRQGNPLILNAPTDIKGTDIAVVLRMHKSASESNGIARLYGPDGGFL